MSFVCYKADLPTLIVIYIKQVIELVAILMEFLMGVCSQNILVIR